MLPPTKQELSSAPETQAGLSQRGVGHPRTPLTPHLTRQPPFVKAAVGALRKTPAFLSTEVKIHETKSNLHEFLHACCSGWKFGGCVLKAFYSNPPLCLPVHESQWPIEWHERPLVVNVRSCHRCKHPTGSMIVKKSLGAFLSLVDTPRSALPCRL